MKKMILALSMLAAQQSFAAPATEYTCSGFDKVSGKEVAFEVLMGDHGPFDGYTNQAVTVMRADGSTVYFQLYGANKKNNCKKNEHGEIMLAKGFNDNGDVTTLKVNCGAIKLNISGTCKINR